ncbi:hypothetical protein cyc_07652 [Cyclospora cayetanensis]|uniref:Uncharacterized protein n=1 Tax=Cyclospora cayetanensis TaxID=88456 RepID=A0A1D3D7M9_9EIME|nr:hypothetical protein cyc_07652 [Cyclospora cayetanensis]
MPLKAYKVYDGGMQENHMAFKPEEQNTGPKWAQPVEQHAGETTVESDSEASTKPRWSIEQPEELVETATDYRFLKTLSSEKYILIVIYFIAVGWITSFYQEGHDRILVQKAQDFLGSALPFSFIPCIILGKLSEFLGIIPVMGIVNTAGLLAYAFSLKQAATTGIISVLCFMVYMSLFVSQVFVYIESTFPAIYFGRLIGIVQLARAERFLRAFKRASYPYIKLNCLE